MCLQDRLSFSSRQVTAANVQDLLHIAVNKSDTTAATQLLTFLRLPRSSKGHAALLQQLTPALLLHLLCTAVERQHVCVVEQLLRLPAVQQLQPADVASVIQAALTPGRSMVMLTGEQFETRDMRNSFAGSSRCACSGSAVATAEPAFILAPSHNLSAGPEHAVVLLPMLTQGPCLLVLHMPSDSRCLLCSLCVPQPCASRLCRRCWTRPTVRAALLLQCWPTQPLLHTTAWRCCAAVQQRGRCSQQRWRGCWLQH